MAIKKSELYKSLWASCNELRGSMDASQYKDYVLVMLFMKYVSDKKDPLIDIPPNASFYDMVKHKGKTDIGDKINKIIGAFAKVNKLTGIITVADFNDGEKLGKGKDKVDKLSNLISIFEKPELDFSTNRADGDDLLGDAYEFLMRHFATESGKSKGQFYTPAEVSRIMAKVIGIDKSESPSETIYDPACGSGSLLLKAADEATHGITIYGQENDNATRALAVMNMWLHGHTEAEIEQGNTIASPHFTDKSKVALKQFDYAVANPPFSYKSWMNGLENPLEDVYKRFEGYGAIPPKKNGDFAFLLHLIKSLKSNGKACIVLPMGVLFRANAEGTIRRKIVRMGYIKGIIALPLNLFYGTGIGACLIVIDKEGAENRKDIFMIDASNEFMKDGNKNRLREQDIHKIIDTFTQRIVIAKYSSAVSLEEISGIKNDYNLNISRYIDVQEDEDIQDIEAHLIGGISDTDINALKKYWIVYPSLKNSLFKNIDGRPGYNQLVIRHENIQDFIFDHPEFKAFNNELNGVFENWKLKTIKVLEKLDKGLKPKKAIQNIAESLLKAFENKALTDKYAMYQHLMDYWSETMQDDFYELAADGWAAGHDAKRLTKKSQKKDGKSVAVDILGIEGIEGRLIPPTLLIQEYFKSERDYIDRMGEEIEILTGQLEEIRDDQMEEDNLLAEVIDDKGKITKNAIKSRMKLLTTLSGGKKNVQDENQEEFGVLEIYLDKMEQESKKTDKIKAALDDLDKKVVSKYRELTIDEVKHLIIEKKWMADIENRIRLEIDSISNHLTLRIKELAIRYESPMQLIDAELNELTEKVKKHLENMDFAW